MTQNFSKTLGEICRPRQWPTLSNKDLTPNGYPFYGANGKIGFSSLFTHERPTLLIGCRGSCGTVHITEAYSYANGNAMALDDLDEDAADIRYLYHYFSRRGFRDVTTGTSQPQIIQQHLRTVEIPLPPLEEQRRIAVILDKSAEFSAATGHRENMVKAFPASLYVEMFGDPKRNPLRWPLLGLGEICQNEDSKRVPVKSSDRKAMQGKYPYYGASGIIDHVDDYLFEGERLLVGEDGANLLARSSPIAFIARGKYWVNNHAHVLSENGRAKLRFLEIYFSLVDLKPFVTGSAQPKLTRSALDSLSVPLPPMDMQERFDSILARASVQASRVEASAGYARSLMNAVRQVFLQAEAA